MLTSVAVGCGPLPVVEAVAGGAVGEGSEVGGVALEGAAAPAGGGVAESGGALSGVATTGGDASDAMAKTTETFVRTRAWRTLAGPHRKTRGPQRTPAYPPSYPAKKLLLRYQNRRPRQPPCGQHTANTRSTHGQHTANTTVNISRFE